MRERKLHDFVYHRANGVLRRLREYADRFDTLRHLYNGVRDRPILYRWGLLVRDRYNKLLG